MERLQTRRSGEPGFVGRSVGRRHGSIASAEETGVGVFAPAFAADHCNKQPNNWCERAGWNTHLALVDNLILAAKSAADFRRLHRMMVEACDQWGLTLHEDTLALLVEQLPGGGHPRRAKDCPSAGQHDILGGHVVKERFRPVDHRIAEAWNRLWSVRPFLTSRLKHQGQIAPVACQRLACSHMESPGLASTEGRPQNSRGCHYPYDQNHHA